MYKSLPFIQKVILLSNLCYKSAGCVKKTRRWHAVHIVWSQPVHLYPLKTFLVQHDIFVSESSLISGHLQAFLVCLPPPPLFILAVHCLVLYACQAVWCMFLLPASGTCLLQSCKRAPLHQPAKLEANYLFYGSLIYSLLHIHLEIQITFTPSSFRPRQVYRPRAIVGVFHGIFVGCYTSKR